MVMHTTRRGLSLLEVLFAMVLASVAIPVALGAVSQGMTFTLRAHRQQIEMRLAEGKMQELIASGQWQYAARGELENNPEYLWRLRKNTWHVPGVYQLHLDVGRELENSRNYVSLVTLVCTVVESSSEEGEVE